MREHVGVHHLPVGPEKEAGGEGGAQVVKLAAPPGAAADGFDTDTLAVKSGEPFAIEFDNRICDLDLRHV